MNWPWHQLETVSRLSTGVFKVMRMARARTTVTWFSVDGNGYMILVLFGIRACDLSPPHYTI